MGNKITEKTEWEATASLLGDYKVSFSDHWSYNFRHDPKRLAFVLSRYKFASKMLASSGRVIELGCGEGIGAPILSEKAEHYTGIDLDLSSIETAKKTFYSDRFTFTHDDFMGKTYDKFQGVISLDVAEHILPEYEPLYFQTVWQNLHEKGIAIIGTPNMTAAAHASLPSQLGHVNLFTQERLKRTLSRYFHTVLPFGMNDEIVHTGFAPMSHYLLSVCCDKKTRPS